MTAKPISEDYTYDFSKVFEDNNKQEPTIQTQKSSSPQENIRIQQQPSSRNPYLQKITFEDFIKNKEVAFATFSNHPSTKDQFSEVDVTYLKKAVDNRGRQCLVALLGSGIFVYNIDKALRYRSIVHGMTYRWTVFGSFIKYMLIPQSITGFFDNHIFYPLLTKDLQQITNKYDFNQEDYKQAFEDLKQGKTKLIEQI